MRRWVLLTLLVLVAGPARGASEPKHLSIFYQGNVNGEIEPCGCPTIPLGGLSRKAAVIDKMRKKQPVLVVDAGDLLFPDELIGPDQAEQRRIKAELILKANQAMGNAALGLGDQDLAFGVSFLKEMQNKYDAPFLSANLVDKRSMRPVFPTDKIVETARARVKALRKKKVDYVVALTSQGVKADEKLAHDVAGIDLIIGSHSNSNLVDARKVSGTWIVQTGSGGENLGQLEFTLLGEPKTELRKAVPATFDVLGTGDGPTQSEFLNDVIPLAPDMGADAEVEPLVVDAKKKIQDLPVELTPAKLDGAFIGAQACRGCHAEQYENWTRTPHARAYQTLIEFQRQYDFDCVGCHTTAWKKDGGFASPWSVGELKNVQCEMCHGAGRSHAQAPKKNPLIQRPEETTCRGCHSLEQTGDRFKYEQYLPKVSH